MAKFFMTMKSKFYFVRHGETDWNRQQLAQGQKDIPLNEKGRADALLLAKTLSPFEKVFSSPLQRAFETAKILHPGDIILLDELKERNWGELEGMSSEKMYEIEKREEDQKDFICHPSIETRASFLARVERGLDIILKEKEPLVVSHGRVFLALCEILKRPLVRQVPHTQLMTLEY